ncbi:mCG146938 [Mus musculus]|nr:mCG146938 [Mus musculus]
MGFEAVRVKIVNLTKQNIIKESPLGVSEGFSRSDQLRREDPFYRHNVTSHLRLVLVYLPHRQS